MRWPIAIGRSSGVSTSQTPSWKRGQRGWKLQAAGGLIGFGTSPSSTICFRARPSSGSGIGTADSSAPVYGCFGAAYSSSRRATSTALPRYITITRSEM